MGLTFTSCSFRVDHARFTREFRLFHAPVSYFFRIYSKSLANVRDARETNLQASALEVKGQNETQLIHNVYIERVNIINHMNTNN